MKLLRQAAKNKTRQSTPLFDKSPVVSWNAKTQELDLRVRDVPHETAGNSTRHDYFVSVSIQEIKDMIDCLAQNARK